MWFWKQNMLMKLSQYQIYLLHLLSYFFTGLVWWTGEGPRKHHLIEPNWNTISIQMWKCSILIFYSILKDVGFYVSILNRQRCRVAVSENMEVIQSTSKTGFKIQIFTHQPAHQSPWPGKGHSLTGWVSWPSKGRWIKFTKQLQREPFHLWPPGWITATH